MIDILIQTKICRNSSFFKRFCLGSLFFLHFIYINILLIKYAKLILGSRRASYSEQGTFSFAFYPLALKLLWAPIVDSLFIKRIGRRKTWMIPCQFLSGLILLTSAQYVNNLLDYEKENDAKSGKSRFW